MSGWTVLIWAATCAIGAILFLKIVADSLAGVGARLARRERAAQRELEERTGQAETAAAVGNAA